MIQNYKIDGKVAERLAKAYGGRASDVLDIAVKEDKMGLLAPGYPYIEAEVVYCCRYEWVLHATDILARRTRLAFLNKDMVTHSLTHSFTHSLIHSLTHSLNYSLTYLLPYLLTHSLGM